MPNAARRARNAVLSLACAASIGMVAGLASCAPTVDNDGCSADVDCQGRAEVCDLTIGMCVPKDVDTTTTESPAPNNFTGKAVPFHRGQVCLPHAVKSGFDVPVRMTPCLHPCLTQGAYKHKHYYECIGSTCDAWAVMYVNVDGTNCPADAFGAFDRSMCVSGTPVDLTIGTTIDSGPVNGTMSFEVPFLTNADAAAIAADFEVPAIQAKIDQYPEDDARMPGGKVISLSPANPEPPATCETGCDCYDIGF